MFTVGRARWPAVMTSRVGSSSGGMDRMNVIHEHVASTMLEHRSWTNVLVMVAVGIDMGARGARGLS
jgi:hypothetical protein